MKKKNRVLLLVLCASVISLSGCGLLDEDEYYEDGYCEGGYYEDSCCEGDYYEDGYYEDDYGEYDSYEDDGWYDYDEADYDDDYYDDDNEDWGNSYGGYSGGQSEKFDLFSSLGSAGEMNGTTVVVSIYADDRSTSWSDGDSKLMERGYTYLDMACKWLTKETAAYGCNAKFVCDWKSDAQLRYDASLNGSLTDDNTMDMIVWEYIENEIDSAKIKEEYKADNIIYMIYVNTPNSNSMTSCTRSYYEDMEYPYEMCFMYMHTDEEEEAPAAFAHEILHTFGVPDLYQADTDGDSYGITQKYVSELEHTQSNDIMFTTYDPRTNEAYYDKIVNEFTEIDAYYAGLTDKSAVVSEWGFDKSQH